MRRALMILMTIGFATAMVLPQAPSASAPSGQKTLAATMNVYVFPTEGQAAEQQGQQAQQATAEQLGNFKKAFSVCLEAKSYLVKF